LIAVGVVVVWNASTELLAPKRRVLQDYHREWLERPAEHGVSIQRFSAMDGQVPCLVVMPDAAAGLSKRGETVRRQLEAKDVVLRSFGDAFANLVLLHGRNGRKEDLLPVAERFCAVGFRCVIPDLPAHGESPLKTVRFGNSDFEASIPATVLAEARARFHFPDEPAGLWGMSMGGAFLARAASLPDAPWKALVVVCSFDSLDAVVGQKVASYTSVTAPLWNLLIAQVCVARGGVDPVSVRPSKWASLIQTPVFVAHGDADSLITLDQGRRLFEAYASKDKAWTVVKDGDHNRILVTEHPLYAEMAAWYLKYLRAEEK
jgi:alpha-beta hydrolase superfamily lysophospholipase